MIYMVFIIIISLILITVMVTMNAQHGKISERPLRRKILDDTANLLFFTIVLCCLFFFVEKVKIILSLVAILLITLLFIHKAGVKKVINIFLVRSTLFTSLRNRQNSSAVGFDKPPVSDAPDQPAQRQAIYREYILSFIVLFCKRAVLLIVFSLLIIWSVHNCFADQKIVDILKPFSDEKFLIDALILLNNWGFIFNCWKFSSDYQAIQKEKYNAELERIIRKLDRREHDI